MLYLLVFLAGSFMSGVVLTWFFYRAAVKFELECEYRYKEEYMQKLQQLMDMLKSAK